MTLDEIASHPGSHTLMRTVVKFLKKGITSVDLIARAYHPHALEKREKLKTLGLVSKTRRKRAQLSFCKREVRNSLKYLEREASDFPIK